MFVTALLSPLAFALLVACCKAAARSTLRPLLRLRRAHNVLLCLYSAFVAIFSARKLLNAGRLDLASSGVWPLLCRSGPETPPLWLESKVWEWFDTVCIFASGKTPGMLHLGHHATAASVTALNMRNKPTPIFDLGTLLNAVVHTIMYAYYAAPDFLRPLRRSITRAQIAQHFVVLLSCVTALNSRECDAPALPYGVAVAAYAFYFAAFVQFYFRSYLRKRAD